jgi:hypothetical protein
MLEDYSLLLATFWNQSEINFNLKVGTNIYKLLTCFLVTKSQETIIKHCDIMLLLSCLLPSLHQSFSLSISGWLVNPSFSLCVSFLCIFFHFLLPCSSANNDCHISVRQRIIWSLTLPRVASQQNFHFLTSRTKQDDKSCNFTILHNLL